MAAEQPTIAAELWKPVVGYEGRYDVSNFGRVRSVGRLRKLWADKDGYHRVTLRRSGERSSVPVHRMVLEAFIGPCPGGMEACHNDGNRANNALENLRWDTHKNNHADRAQHGTLCRGERNGRAKLTRGDVAVVRERRSAGERLLVLATDFGVSVSHVSRLCNGHCWGTARAKAALLKAQGS